MRSSRLSMGPVRAPLAPVFGAAAVILTGAPALADTSYTPYPYGAPGDAGATDQCPAGAYLVGVHASTGAWVNQLGIVCSAVRPDGRSLDAQFSAPMRGSRPGGDGDRRYTCGPDEVVSGVSVSAAESKKQVAVVTLTCSSISGVARIELFAGPEGTSDLNRAKILGMNNGRVQENNQPCRAGEAGFALALRYGQDLNALGLLCRPLSPPPVMSNAGRPIKLTGRPTAPVMSNAGSPIRATGQPTPVMSNAGDPIKATGRPAPSPDMPPPASTLPPESTAPAGPFKGYAGIWAVATVDGAEYQMILRVDGDVITGDFTNLHNAAFSGSLTGRLVNDHAAIVWTQPNHPDSAGQPFQGTGIIRVHADNTFGGGMTYKAPGAVQGSYYGWYGTLVRALPVVKHPAGAPSGPAAPNPATP